MRMVARENQGAASKYLSFAVLFISAVVTFASQGLRSEAEIPQKSCVDFGISLDKQSYILGEDVWLKILMTNNCDTAVTVTGLNGSADALTLFVVGSSGKRLRSSGLLDGHWYADLDIELDPTDSQGLLISLVQSHGTAAPGYTPGRFLPQGRYSVFCHLYSPSSGYSFVSDTLWFEITEPTGYDLEAVREYVQVEAAVAKIGQAFYRERRAEGLKLYTDYLEEYPGSPVAPRLLRKLQSIDRARLVMYSNWLVNRYADSPFSAAALAHLLYEKDLNREALLNSIADRKGDSHLRLVAREILAGRRAVCMAPAALYRIARQLKKEP